MYRVTDGMTGCVTSSTESSKTVVSLGTCHVYLERYH